MRSSKSGGLFLMSVILLGFALVAHAAVQFSYDAASGEPGGDWTLASSGTAAIVSGGVEYDGTAYWQVDDVSNVGRSWYTGNPGGYLSYANTRGSAFGWTYTAKIRVIESNDVDNVVSLQLVDGVNRWTVFINEDGVYDGSVYLNSMDATDAYHTYQMIYDPASPSNVTVYVDGSNVGVITPVTVYSYSANFGSQSTNGVGAGRYSLITFEDGMNPVADTFVSSEPTLIRYRATDGDPGSVYWIRGDSVPAEAGVCVGGVEDDGTYYWEIVDTDACITQYSSVDLPSYGTTRGSANGWTYSAKVKVIENVEGNAGVVLRIVDGIQAWIVDITEVGVSGNGAIMSSFDTTDAYHTYQMIYDPSSPSVVTVYADGIDCGTITNSGTSYTYALNFGGGSTPGHGIGRFSEVTFDTGMNPVATGVVQNPASLFRYRANEDPTLSGWALSSSGTTATVVGGVEGDGTKYWEIADTASGMTQYATNYVLSYGTTRAAAEGWTYTAKLKVVDCDEGASAVIMRFLEGHHVWIVNISEVGVTIGSTVVAMFDTTDGYHTYQLIGNPDDTTKVDVYVDGVLCLAGYTQGYTYAGYGAMFGSGSTPGVGTARYNEVRYELGQNPVDATLALSASIVPGTSALPSVQNVTIYSSIPAATIRYTTDGSDPTETNGTVIASGGSVLVDRVMTIKAKAWLDGSAPSDIVTASYTFAFDDPAGIPQGTASIDGDLSDWAGASWADVDYAYDESATDVAEAYYAARWDAGKIYVALKVRDTDHQFTDNYSTWDGRDAAEFYIHTTGEGAVHYPDCEVAQQYSVGFDTSGTGSVWYGLGNTDMYWDYIPTMFAPSSAAFSAAGSIDGQWLYYEVAMTAYEFFGEVNGSANIASPLALGDLVGVDVCVVARDSSDYTGMLSANAKVGKSSDYSQIGFHELVAASTPVLHSGDANGDGAVDVGDLGILAANYGTASGATWALGDFNGDGAVDVGDLGILAANYGYNSSGADFDADYAKVFGEEATSESLCSLLGLPLIAGLVLMSLMLAKLED